MATLQFIKPKRLLVAGIAIVLLGGGIIAAALLRPDPTVPFKAEKLSLAYPNAYERRAVPLPAKDQRSYYLLKLGAEDPARSIDLAREKGAIIGANVTKTNFLDYLETNAGRSIAITHKGYKKMGVDRIQVSSRDASVISFSYTGADSRTTVYAKLFIIPIGNDGYYLTMQSPDSKLLDKESDQIQQSLTSD